MKESRVDQITNLKSKSKPDLIVQAGIEAYVGNTPLIPLRRISARTSNSIQIYAKAEWFNPGGSIKSRPAINIINKAISDGELTIGKRLMDATSGNMGIAYATFGAAFEIPITLTIPANASNERLSILRALGAELILTDPLDGTDGAIRVAKKLVQDHPEQYFYANQYDNPANWLAHYESTGPEIFNQTGGCVTHFIAGMGTTGTMTGVGNYLHRIDPVIELIGVQPDTPFHGLEGLKHLNSAIKPEIYDPGITNRIIEIQTEEAYEMVRVLAREEGLFVGISSGANALAALKVAEHLDEGMVVTVFPDAGYKYISEDALWKVKSVKENKL